MKNWELYWQRSGKYLATVQAETAEQAIAKAPCKHWCRNATCLWAQESNPVAGYVAAGLGEW